MIHEKLHEEMHKRCETVKLKLQSIVHPSYVEAFSEILSYSWHENLPIAEKIADELDLYQIDFCALALDEKSFIESFWKEQERNYG